MLLLNHKDAVSATSRACHQQYNAVDRSDLGGGHVINHHHLIEVGWEEVVS